MNYSIIPEIISERKIEFFNEMAMPVKICGEADSIYVYPFEEPYLVIDTFAKKTTKKVEIVNIEIEELRKLDYIVTVFKVTPRTSWFRGQKRIYRLERKEQRTPGARRLNYIPTDHKVQKDIPNKRIRIAGPNAGVNGFGQWNEIK